MKRNIIYQMFLRSATRRGMLKDGEKLLEHIASLGVDIVYLCPVFEADDDENVEFWSKRQCDSGLNNPKNPYRMKDYFKIDKEYGSAEDLKCFVNTAHGHGLKVLLDLVYYHCGPKANILGMNKEFIKRLPDGTPDCGDWRFPKLNYECAELREYMYKNMEYLVREFDVDGFRCDVGELVPLDFWREGVRRIKKIKNDLIMINEGGNKEFIKSGVFDMNYHLSWGLDTLLQFRERFSEEVGNTDMAERKLICFENHDAANDAGQERLDKKHGHKLCNALLALMFTCGCVPFIYNGNEICDSAQHSIYGNRFHGKNMYVDWSEAVTDYGKERIGLIRKLSSIYHNIGAVTDGKTTILCDDSGLIAFERVNNSEKLIVTANLTEEFKELTLDLTAAKKLLSQNAVCGDGKIKLESGGFIICREVL